MNNIYLIGFMGTGKSTVAKKLQRFLPFQVVEMDEAIERVEAMSIPEIFAQKTEAYFRKVEKEVISELADEEDLIIALGGGAFEDEETRNILEKTGKVIYLKSSVERLLNRIKDDKNRPLLQCDNPKDKLEELLKMREPNYLKAEFVIETDNKEINDIVNNIVELMEFT